MGQITNLETGEVSGKIMTTEDVQRIAGEFSVRWAARGEQQSFIADETGTLIVATPETTTTHSPDGSTVTYPTLPIERSYE